MKVLLWSPGGSSNAVYHGPGSFACRMYGAGRDLPMRVSLAHGRPDHPIESLYADQFFVGRFATSPIGLASFLSRSRKWLRRNVRAYDVFHGLSAYQHSVTPARIAEECGVPAIVFVTNHRLDLADKRGLRSLAGLPRRRRKTVASLSAVVAMSDAIHAELREYGIPEARIARIPMGVDTDHFRPALDEQEKSQLRRELAWPELPTIAFVGGITPRKRPHLLVEAIRALADKGLDCQLVLIGPVNDQSYATRLKARAQELGISDRVIWCGFRSDIAPLLRAADFFALPSENEGMPAALVEGMATGLPAIVTPVSGMTDLVTDGEQGRIVEPTPPAIADALADYLSDTALASEAQRAARTRVETSYSSRAVVSAYHELFRRVIEGRAASIGS